MERTKTLEDIRAIDKEVLTPADVAGYLGTASYSLNLMKKAGRSLEFPAALVGTRVRIPKEGFIRWAEGRQAIDTLIVRFMDLVGEHCPGLEDVLKEWRGKHETRQDAG